MKTTSLEQSHMERVGPIRANADTAQQAAAAISAGASGIGLCRSEFMLLGRERLAVMRSILVEGDKGSRRKAVDTVLPSHQADFEAMFRIVAPLPIVIRLLDPPLQELLPSLDQLDSDLSGARVEENWEAYHHLNSVRSQHSSLSETNRAMGHRGCRLSVTHPDILRMQVAAILQAALIVTREGKPVIPSILIPRVSSAEETKIVSRLIHQAADAVFRKTGSTVIYRVGALIELPRAAICAGLIAEYVDLLCFGTNDLTQMTFGVSREDMGRYAASYLKQGIFSKNPFVSFDQQGVGYLLSLAIDSAREVKPEMEIGACGDHCSDEVSVGFFRKIGITFVSCAISGITTTKRAWTKGTINKEKA